MIVTFWLDWARAEAATVMAARALKSIVNECREEVGGGKGEVGRSERRRRRR